MMPIQQQQQEPAPAPEDLGLGVGVDPQEMDEGAVEPQEDMPDQEPEMQEPLPEPAPLPVDPIMAAISSILELPGPDAIRLIYQLAASAAKARAKIRESASSLDARGYHALLSKSPEAKYATELLAARRELDALAQERRRLNLEAVKAREAGRLAPASLYEIQATSATSAMEQVAGGVLLFLALPADAISRPQSQQPQPESQLQQEESPQ